MTIHNPQLLKEFVESNPKLVSRKQSIPYPDLYVLKYQRCVFYNNKWNDILRECRGLVVDKDYNVVVHPFTKIFNRYENDANMDRDDIVYAVEKVNGFMAAVSMYKGKLIVSTTGSLNSDFVGYAKEMLGDMHHLSDMDGLTLLFEIVHPNDPHIIKEELGAYLIGARVIGSGVMLKEHTLDQIGLDCNFKRPKWSLERFSDAVVMAKEATHEGYVLRRANDDYTLKIKSPYYLVTKLFARMGLTKLEHFLNNPNWGALKVDEEFIPLINYLISIKESFIILNEQQKIEVIRDFIYEQRK